MDVAKRIAEIEAFLRFVVEEWPRLRQCVAEQISRRCRRCILSEKCSPLVNGLCEVCRSGPELEATSPLVHSNRATMPGELDGILCDHAGRGRGQHDALVLFSGGKDSTYLLHRLCREHPALRLLAVTIDNGFMSQVALANARRVIERLNRTDHMIFTPKPNLFRKTFRHAFTHLNAGGCYSTVDRMDGDLVFDIARNLAAALEIPLVIAGLSPTQVERILGLKHFESLRAVECSRRSHSAGFNLAELYDPGDWAYWWDGSAWPIERVPRVLFPFYAWEYDEQRIRAEVVQSGLIETGNDNPLVTNNDTIPLMLAVDVMFLGYSGFEPEFAELVRAGKADRAWWVSVFESLEYQARRGSFLPRCVADTLERLGLSHGDVGLTTEDTGPVDRPASRCQSTHAAAANERAAQHRGNCHAPAEN
jgi:hypothetical protein